MVLLNNFKYVIKVMKALKPWNRSRLVSFL